MNEKLFLLIQADSERNNPVWAAYASVLMGQAEEFNLRISLDDIGDMADLMFEDQELTEAVITTANALLDDWCGYRKERECVIS